MLGVAAFLVSMVYLIRNENRHLNEAASRIGGPGAPASDDMGGE